MAKKEAFWVGKGLMERLKIKDVIEIEPYTIDELHELGFDKEMLYKHHTRGSDIKTKNKMTRNKLQTRKY